MKNLLALSLCAALPCAALSDDLVYRVVPDETSKEISGWENASTDLKATIEGITKSGATVLVMNGRYVITNQIEHTKSGTDNLTIRSVNPTTGLTDDPTQGGGGAVFDAEGKCRIIKCGRTVTFQGITFANGHGVKSETAEKATDDLGQGGAIYAGNHVLYLNDCVFTNNYTDADGGAIGTYWGGYFHGAISNCVFVGNTAFGVNQGGGAIMAFNLGVNGLNILDCDFIDNSVVSNKVGNGVAILLHQGDSQVTMRGCRFVGNKSQDTTSDSSRKSRTIVQFSKGTNRIVDDCYFEKNIGIPLAFSYNSGYATNCVVAGNDGAAFVTCGAEMTIDGCVFTNNVMDAATYNTGAKGHFRNCLIADNTFSNLLSLHYAYVSAPTRFENCTIAGNSFKYIATVYDNRTDVTEYTAGLAMTNTIFYGNTVTRTSADAIGAKLACSFANVCTDNAVLQARVTSVGGSYISDDPLFVDVASGDYRLKRKSPCREAGVWLDWMAGATDLAGNPRVLDRDGRVSETALPDIGCYECAEKTPGLLLIIR